MKTTSFLPSMITSAAIASGILLATVHTGSAVACPFAKGKGIFGTNQSLTIDPSKLLLGIAAVAGTATIAGMFAYRHRKATQPTLETSIPSVFPILIPPEALNNSMAIEEETSDMAAK